MDRCPVTRPQGFREEFVSQSSPMSQVDPVGKSPPPPPTTPRSTYPIRPVHTLLRHQHCAKVRSHLKCSRVSRASGTELPSLLSPGAELCSWQKLVTKFFLVLVHNKSRVPKKSRSPPQRRKGSAGSNGGLGSVSRSPEISSHPSRASAK